MFKWLKKKEEPKKKELSYSGSPFEFKSTKEYVVTDNEDAVIERDELTQQIEKIDSYIERIDTHIEKIDEELKTCMEGYMSEEEMQRSMADLNIDRPLSSSV